MTLKEQLIKIKDNWLLVLLVLVIFVFFMGGFESIETRVQDYGERYSQESKMAVPAMSAQRTSLYEPRSRDFAPEIAERLITKTARLTTEVEQGKFRDAEQQLKSVIKSSESYLLNENVNTYDTGEKNEYTIGYYDIKVDAKKYDAVANQLKGIGKLTAFNENAEDITGVHTNVKIELENERTRLQRYKDMYAEAKEVEDKINLNDRIFNQENTIRYLEERLENLDKQVLYSTINVNLREKKSDYADIELVDVSTLTAAFVGSIDTLAVLAVAILPWAVVLWLIVIVWRKLSKPKKAK